MEPKCFQCAIEVYNYTLYCSDIVILYSLNNFQKCVFFLTVNCLDRHVARDPSAVAIIWEKNEPGEQEEVSYKYVRLIVNAVYINVK